MKPYFYPLFLGLIFCSAQAEEIVSGPPVGTQLGEINCYANSGDYAGKEAFNAADIVGNNPGAFLFIHVLNRNTAPVIRGVDQLASEFGLFGFKSFTVSLTDDRTSGEELIQRVNRSLKLRNPMVLSLDGLDGPGNLALNRRCTLSLVVVNSGKVTDAFGYTDTNLEDVGRIRKSFETAIGEIPRNPDELMRFAMETLPEGEKALREFAARQAVELYQARRKASEDLVNSRRYPASREGMMRRSRNSGNDRNMKRGDSPRRPRVENADRADKEPKEKERVRRGGPPSDPQLNSLLRSFIRKENSKERVDQIFADIEKRGNESDELGKEAVSMFQLMLSFPDRYGSEHAQNLAKKFLKDRGKE